jgi:hypothetical protein
VTKSELLVYYLENKRARLRDFAAGLGIDRNEAAHLRVYMRENLEKLVQENCEENKPN